MSNPEYAKKHWLTVQADKAIELALSVGNYGPLIDEDLSREELETEYADALRHVAAGLLAAMEFHKALVRCKSDTKIPESRLTNQTTHLYPVHAKMLAAADSIQAVSEFMEWFVPRFCAMMERDVERAVAEFFHIDTAKLEQEKQAMLAADRQRGDA